MCKLFAYANLYAKQSTWVDFGLVKACMGAMGLIVGMFLPRERRKPIAICAAVVFVATYILLIYRLLKTILPEIAGD